jgi:molecular chaperone DnaJ
VKKDYYEILGVAPHASKEEIRNAYRELVKKYHPDKYMDNPLADLAQEKLKDINEAYEFLMNNHSESNNNSGYNNRNYHHNRDNTFQEVRNLIQVKNWEAAYSLLQTLDPKHPDWFFLNGVIALNKGWYQQAFDNIQTALRMDPGNPEYLSVWNNLQKNTNYYHNASMQRGYRNNGLCELCTCLYCSDCCCECFGGDFIECC